MRPLTVPLVLSLVSTAIAQSPLPQLPQTPQTPRVSSVHVTYTHQGVDALRGQLGRSGRNLPALALYEVGACATAGDYPTAQTVWLRQLAAPELILLSPSAGAATLEHERERGWRGKLGHALALSPVAVFAAQKAIGEDARTSREIIPALAIALTSYISGLRASSVAKPISFEDPGALKLAPCGSFHAIGLWNRARPVRALERDAILRSN